jgi:DGQHR domain-containing protein
MDRDFVVTRFGSKIELGPCVVGHTIDHAAVRGFAHLDELAAFSSPDVFDDEVNPTGTQRELKRGHADAAFKYSTGPRKAGGANARSLPEIILNVRDMQVVEVSDWVSGQAFYFDSHSTRDDLPRDAVKVTIDLDAIEYPKTTIGPEISRVDGNHRLDGPDRYLERLASDDESDEIAFPTVPFMLFLDLTLDEELKLFNDFNAKHEGMESSLIITQNVRLASDDLKTDPRRVSEWLGFQLTRRDRAFADIAFVGGSKTGAKEAGKSLRVTLSAIRAAAALMVRHSNTLQKTLVGQPDAILNIIDNFWKAVARVFPEAWNDKKNFILLQSIGLNGFAEFAGTVIDRAGASVSEDDFVQVLESVKSGIRLEREAHPGVAGAGGASQIAKMLLDAYTTESMMRAKLLQVVGAPAPSTDEKVAALAEDQQPTAPESSEN